MTSRRRIASLPFLATLLVVVLALTGCSGDKAAEASPDPEPSATASDPQPSTTPGAAGTQPAPTSETPTPTATASDCPASSATAIPDGTWSGPITMDVDGRGGEAGFASSQGTGSLRAVVADGKVVSGTWNVHWKSTGHAETAQAAATVTLTGKIVGGVKGSAAKPLVVGTWSIAGKAKVTKPIITEVPINESGQDSETMAIASTTCDKVTGTFIPSFNSKDAQASFTGTARWVGSRED